MKRKFADRVDWKRVEKRDYRCLYISEEGFTGYVSLIHLVEVTRPLVTQLAGIEMRIADNGYYWMQHFPLEANHCVTTMLNEKKEVIQWYIDISKEVGLSERGIPYWDDLYLDIIVLHDNRFTIKDEDELEEALASADIDEADYQLARNEMKRVIIEIENNTNYILNNGMNHFSKLLSKSS